MKKVCGICLFFLTFGFLFLCLNFFCIYSFLQIFVKTFSDDGEMTLSDLYKKNLDDDEDGEDFVEGQ